MKIYAKIHTSLHTSEIHSAHFEIPFAHFVLQNAISCTGDPSFDGISEWNSDHDCRIFHLKVTWHNSKYIAGQ